MQTISVESHAPEQTADLGERIAALLEAGDVLLLQGELGAGKTCLTQGVARGLGVQEPVCSPTFVLVGEYAGRLRLLHADLYRLDNPAEVEELDLARLSEDGVLVVEWPERAPQWLPREHLLVRMEHDGPNGRRIRVEGRGHRAQQLVARLSESVPTARALSRR